MRDELKKNLQYLFSSLEKQLAEKGIPFNFPALLNLLNFAPEEVQKALAQLGLWLTDPLAFYLNLKPLEISELRVGFQINSSRIPPGEVIGSILQYSGERLVRFLLEKHLPPGKNKVEIIGCGIEFLQSWNNKNLQIYVEVESAELESMLTRLSQGQSVEQEFVAVSLNTEKQHFARVNYTMRITHQALLP